jgi:hypothetical protein
MPVKKTFLLVSSAWLTFVLGCATAPGDQEPPVASTEQDIQTFNLLLSGTGTGAGIISANPPDTDFLSSCFPPCIFHYIAGTPAQVTLTAHPRGVSTFAGWSVCLHPSGNTCIVDNNMPNRAATAIFNCSKGVDEDCFDSCVSSCIQRTHNAPSCSSSCQQTCNPCL